MADTQGPGECLGDYFLPQLMRPGRLAGERGGHMQYESKDRQVRAAAHRRAAREAEVYGMPGMASIDWEMAEWLDPTPRVPREARTDTRSRRN